MGTGSGFLEEPCGLAPEEPVSGLHLAECLHEAGIPSGVFNVVLGGATAGKALVGDARVKAVSFTGSVEVGAAVREAATRTGKRVQLELGGHNPLLVLADADLQKAAESAFAGAFWSAGQKCTATRRILVHQDVHERFRELLLRRIERATIGDPSLDETEVGPLVSESQLDDVLASIERGQSEGGRLLAGGERLDRDGLLPPSDPVRGRR